MKEITCKKCGSHWDEPDVFDDNVFERYAEIFRSPDAIAAMRYLGEQAGVSPRGMKGICYHTTREEGICNQCNTPLESKGKTVCKQCSSINYDW